MGVSQAAVRDEPICGFCYQRRIRQPLVFDTEHGFWECPLCKAKTETAAADETAFRAKLEEAKKRDPGRWAGMIAAKRKGGSRSSKRKRKKIPNRSWRERPATLI